MGSETEIVWACRCSVCRLQPPSRHGIALDGSSSNMLFAGSRAAGNLPDLPPEACTAREATEGKTPRNHRLHHLLMAVTAVRAGCQQVQATQPDIGVISDQIKLRTELLLVLRTLRDQIMHERFGSFSSGRLRDRRRRPNPRSR